MRELSTSKTQLSVNERDTVNSFINDQKNGPIDTQQHDSVSSVKTQEVKKEMWSVIT